MLYAAVAEAAGAIAPAAPVLTSDKLTALNESYAKAWDAMIAIKDPRSKEAKDAKLAVWKIDGEIKSEEAAIVKSQNEAKLTEKRNERLALNQTQLSAFEALVTARLDKKPDAAKIAELETSFNTAKEAVDNELLAKYAASKSAKAVVASDGADTGTDANKAAIIELHIAGKTNKEIEELGYKRSTVWHAVNNYKKANAV